MENEISYEKFDDGSVGVYYEGFSGSFYPDTKEIVVDSSDGTAISLEALEYLIKKLNEYKQ